MGLCLQPHEPRCQGLRSVARHVCKGPRPTRRAQQRSGGIADNDAMKRILGLSWLDCAFTAEGLWIGEVDTVFSMRPSR